MSKQTVFKKVMVSDRLPVEWRGIFGFECYYEVSNTGLIRSLDRVIIDKRGSEQEYFITCNESDINIQPFNLGLYFLYSSKITKEVMESFKV